MCDHLSRHAVAGALMQPTRNSPSEEEEDEPPPVPRRKPCPCLALLPVGVAWPPHYCGAGGLLNRRFTLTPLPRGRGAGCFCGPILTLASFRELPGTVPCGARTFLDACEKRRGRPTGLRLFHYNASI